MVLPLVLPVYLSFVHYDYCQFQVSTDGGNNWIGQCGLHTVPGVGGNGSVQPNGQPIYEGTKDWVREEISLSDYLGETIKVRFQLRSDGGVNMDGFYFDDFTIHKGVTGIGLDEQELYFTVYPNPSKTSFMITSSDNLLNYTYSILDMNGKVVLQDKIDNSASEWNVSVGNLTNGVYTLVLNNASGTAQSQKKMVILK